MLKKLKHNIEKYGSDIVFSNFNQFLVKIFSLGNSVLLTRMGSKELYGEYLFISSIIGLLSITSIPGVRTLILKWSSKGKSDKFSQVTKYSFKWSLLGLVLLIVYGLYNIYITKSVRGLIIIISAFTLPFITSFHNWEPFLKGQKKFGLLTLLNFIKNLILIFGFYIFIVKEAGLIYIVISHFILGALFNSFTYLFVQKKFTERTDIGKQSFNFKKEALSLSVMDLSSSLFSRVDMIIIGSMFASSQLAIYGLVMKFGDVFIKIIKSTVEAISPTILGKNDIQLKHFYKYFFVVIFLPLLILPIIKYPINILYGKGFEEVIYFSKIYIFVIPLSFVSLITTYFMIKKGLYKQINFSRIITICTVVFLYFLLIPKLSLLGGVLASMSYFLFESILNSYFLKKHKVI